MAEFPRVPLAQVLRQDTNYITELEPRLYSKLSVKLYGRGVVMDAPADGSTVKMNRHQLARPGQVVLSEIWAKKGAIGIVPPEGQGALVTSHFFLFDINESRLLPRFMYWLLCGNYFADELDAQAHGTTGYAAIRPKQFLSLEIPLPPLAEQQRIVARIEALARRVEEARGLRREAVEEADTLIDSAVGTVFLGLHSAERRTLKSLTSKIGSRSTPRGGRASYPSSGIPFIRSMNVRMRHFQWEDIAFIDRATHRSMQGTIVRPSDVLLNITGASIGRVACSPFDLGEANVNQHVTIIRPLELLESRYLMYWLSQPTVQDFINDEQKVQHAKVLQKHKLKGWKYPLYRCLTNATSLFISMTYRPRWTTSAACRARRKRNWMV